MNNIIDIMRFRVVDISSITQPTIHDGRESRHYPWPYLSKFMSLKETTNKGYIFVSNLFKPKIKMLSVSKTSSTNLKTHIQVSNSPFKCINYPAFLHSTSDVYFIKCFSIIKQDSKSVIWPKLSFVICCNTTKH